MKQNIRLRELDFLRGLAIILVLFRHQELFDFTTKMGWIGVDLFFVLSGFLVSGLLFREYLKFGNIKPGLFLIRRGFKIYPIYYLTYILYLAPKLIKNQFEWKGLFADLFFVQNYLYSWGYAYRPSWSLAVEEHFYISFALLLWLGIKYNYVDLKLSLSSKVRTYEFWIFIFMILALCGRIINNIYFQGNGARNITMSHLRVDSLLAGTFISYLYHFKKEKLVLFFSKYDKILIFFAFALLSFTPFKDFEDSFLIRTFGFTFLYISFGIIITYFLVNENINTTLNSIFSNVVVNAISKIGFASYSIYIIHGFVNFIFSLINNFVLNQLLSQTLIFFTTSIASILSGIIMTSYIEKYFLNYREKYFPNRIK